MTPFEERAPQLDAVFRTTSGRTTFPIDPVPRVIGADEWRSVARERKVVQSGQGADEVFGGYYWYPPLLEAADAGLDTYAGAFVERGHRGAAEPGVDAR